MGPVRKSVVAVSLFLATGLLAAPTAVADEGQWTPEQVAGLAEQLRERGFGLQTSDLWNNGKGLMRAAVNLNGCSASFVSNRGLVITNHHCAYGALQRQSTVDHDYITDGFLAGTLEQELEARQTTVRVLERIVDVTDRIEAAAAKAGDDDRARYLAISKTRKQLVQACEQQKPGYRCSVASFDAGSVYRQMEYLELRDIRLVYAPPSAIGEYGGEIDNWMWPRHTGDFSILRAYVGPDGKPADFAKDNKPYQPDTWLQISHEGVSPGDFVAVMGYPGHTDRHLSLAQVKHQVEQALPMRVDLYGEWISILEELGEADPAVAIKVAATKKSLANRHKNARGMLAGIKRMNLLKRKAEFEQRLRAWAQKPANASYQGVLDKLAQHTAEQARDYPRNLLLGHISRGPKLLAVAVDLVRRARAQAQPDLERDDWYMQRNADKLRGRLLQRLRNHDPDVDSQLLASLVVRSQKLEPGQEIAAFAGLQVKDGSRTEVAANLRKLFTGSQLRDQQQLLALFDAADANAIANTKDPLLKLANAIADELEANKKVSEARKGRFARLGPQYFAMLRGQADAPHYPDANGTLRLSYATVQGYAPQEGLLALPQTSVAGQVAKHTGEKPFDLPQNVRDAAAQTPETIWADPALGDVPVCFLSNADTTGGNSGSAVVDGKGRLVGLNFDRVWENISGDFGYTTERSRNITVDIRYLLWLLDRVVGADALLAELGMQEVRSQPAKAAPPRADSSAEAVTNKRPAATSERSTGCSCRSDDSGWSGLWGCALLLGLRRRRRA